MIDLSVVIPCFNEEGNIERLVLKIIDLFNRNFIKGEIILVNDGSTDNTQQVIDKCTDRFKNVFGTAHEKNYGIAESWHTGLQHSRGRFVATIDADMQYNPDDLALLYRIIIYNQCDIIQGWRKDYKDNNLVRKVFSKGLSYLLALLFVIPLPDIKSGLVVYKRDVFFDVLQERNNFFAYHHFCILCALAKGYVLKQIPITFISRRVGQSFMKSPFLFACRSLHDMPRAVRNFGMCARNKNKKIH